MFHLSLSIRGLCFHLLTSWHILFTVAVTDHLKWHSVGNTVSGYPLQPNILWFARKLSSAWQELNSRHICCGKHPALVMAEQLNLVYVRFSMGKSASYRHCWCSVESRDLGGNWQKNPKNQTLTEWEHKLILVFFSKGDGLSRRHRSRGVGDF